MGKIKFVIESIKCERTSIELGQDEIYCGCIFIPVNVYEESLQCINPKSVATDCIFMRTGNEVRPQIADWNFEFELPDEYDNFLLIVQLIEKDDGTIQSKYKNGEITNAIRNVDMWDRIRENPPESFDVGSITGTDESKIWVLLGKLIVKILPTLTSAIAEQIKMDDVISTKQFTKDKISEFSSPKELLFSKMFAKYKMSIKINEI